MPPATPSLRCPGCADSRLQRLNTREGPVERCPSCGGAWLSAGTGAERERWVALAAEEAARVQPGLCSRGLHALAPGAERCACPESLRRCPRCARRLRPMVHQGQDVDLCPTCPGLWLDGGELASLRVALGAPLPPRALRSIQAEGLRRPALVGGIGLVLCILLELGLTALVDAGLHALVSACLRALTSLFAR